MRNRLLTFAVLAGVIGLGAGCFPPPKSPPKTTTTTASTTTTSTTVSTTTTTSVAPALDWSTSPQTLGQSDEVGVSHTVTCPPGGTEFSVWGTVRYTGDSSICTAAVHDGRISFADGGMVTYEMLGGQDSYLGSTQHGVTSHDWGAWGSTFRFV